jgi:hypothetical protein
MNQSPARKLVYLTSASTGVWDYTIEYFEKSLAESSLPAANSSGGSFFTFFAKSLAKLGLLKHLWRSSGPGYLVPLMGPAEYRLFPHCYRHESVVYCYDCWPAYYERWEAMFKRHRMRLAFFSARQSASYFAARLPQMRSVWLPEATDPQAYDRQRLLHEREIEVLEMGRRYEWWHRQVVSDLEYRGVVHRYENPRGQIIFPTRAEFVKGLGNSAISVCFPASLTTPDRAGGVETVTHRYFEAMAAGCLILGHCPAELEDLFGYNPVVEAAPENPLEQLLEIRADLQKYQELVERNYQRLLEVGTWQARVRTLCAALEQAGFITSTQ